MAKVLTLAASVLFAQVSELEWPLPLCCPHRFYCIIASQLIMVEKDVHEFADVEYGNTRITLPLVCMWASTKTKDFIRSSQAAIQTVRWSATMVRLSNHRKMWHGLDGSIDVF